MVPRGAPLTQWLTQWEGRPWQIGDESSEIGDCDSVQRRALATLELLDRQPAADVMLGEELDAGVALSVAHSDQEQLQAARHRVHAPMLTRRSGTAHTSRGCRRSLMPFHEVVLRRNALVCRSVSALSPHGNGRKTALRQLVGPYFATSGHAAIRAVMR